MIGADTMAIGGSEVARDLLRVSNNVSARMRFRLSSSFVANGRSEQIQILQNHQPTR